MTKRRARDLKLLDALDAHPGVAFEGTASRIVREGRDPLQGYPAGARWDPGTFDVIYTSLEREGSLAEVYFHLSRQPVFPSKLVSVLHKISVRTTRTLKLADLEAVERLGVAKKHYGELAYNQTQAIGDAAAFLGFDGMMVPSARLECLNLVLFTDRFSPADLIVKHSEVVDWGAWRRHVKSRGR
jgi:RES domain-containing protein